MMRFERMTVRLGEIVPGANPRKDFGDIHELAAAIEATGGQPVNPPVVVCDGPSYRLVDGERRIRALKTIHDDSTLVDVLVFFNYDEAEQAVAMMATDAKQGLTDEEKARGFQRMLLLGVEEHTVAKASRRKVSDIRKAKQVAADAPEQATLDQMIAAAEFEDEKDRAAVLKAAPEKWRAKAETIRRRIEMETVDAQHVALFEEAGLRVVDKAPEGWRQVKSYYSFEGARNAVAADVELWGTEDTVVCREDGYWWCLYTSLPGEEPVETEEEREARLLLSRRTAAVNAMRSCLLKEICSVDAMPRTQEAAGLLRTRQYSYEHNALTSTLKDELGLSKSLISEVMDSPMSMYELAQFVRQNHVPWHVWIPELLPPACDECDFQMSEEDSWLYELARSEQAKKSAEEAEAAKAAQVRDEPIEEYEDEDEDIEF